MQKCKKANIASDERNITDIDFPASEFDTPNSRAEKWHLLKDWQKKKAEALRISLFFRWSAPLSRTGAGSLKMIRSTKEAATWDEILFLRNNYFEVPTNMRGAFRTNGTDTPKRAGSGSHLDEKMEEKEWWERLVSLYVLVWEINLNGLYLNAAQNILNYKKDEIIYFNQSISNLSKLVHLLYNLLFLFYILLVVFLS